jgi:hypothetical protein
LPQAFSLIEENLRWSDDKRVVHRSTDYTGIAFSLVAHDLFKPYRVIESIQVWVDDGCVWANALSDSQRIVMWFNVQVKQHDFFNDRSK